MTSDSGCSLLHQISCLSPSQIIQKSLLRKINRPYSCTGSDIQHSSGVLDRRGVQFTFEDDAIDVVALVEKRSIS
jgi:hypothetical protein